MEPNIFGLDFNEDNTNYLYLIGGFIVVIIFLCYLKVNLNRIKKL